MKRQQQTTISKKYRTIHILQLRKWNSLYVTGDIQREIRGEA